MEANSLGNLAPELDGLNAKAAILQEGEGRPIR
jgi:hypothetical protein